MECAGILYVYLVIICLFGSHIAIWYIIRHTSFPRFVMLHQEKSGIPD
jgi:hypothetical protein